MRKKSAIETLRAKMGQSAGTKSAPSEAAQVIPLSTAQSEVMPAADSAIHIPEDLLGQVDSEAQQANASDANEIVAQLNKDHFVAPEGGTTSVFREAYDAELQRDRLDRMAVSAFMALHSNRYAVVADANGNTKKLDWARVWLKHPMRRTYPDGIALLPGVEAPAGVYNLWRGYGCTPKQGATFEDVKPFVQHLHLVVCSGDKVSSTYLLGWLARAVQKPALQAEVAIVLQGGRGTGKGTFGRWVRDLFGMHSMHVQHQRHLTGNFNAHLQSCVMLFVDESFFVGDKAGFSVLKSLITEDQITVERKGVDAFTVCNRLKIIMATNDEHAVLAGEDERRFLVLRVSDVKKQDHEYFGKLNAWWDGGGKEAVLGYLLEYDLSQFNIRRVPNTAALEAQKLQSLPPIGAWLLERLQEGRILSHDEWTCELDRKYVALAFDEYVSKHGNRFTKTSASAVGMGLRGYIELGEVREGSGLRRRLWIMPSLEEARRQFETKLGLTHFKWDGDIEDGGDT